MKKRTAIAVFFVISAFACSSNKTDHTSVSPDPVSDRIFVYCEMLRMSNLEIVSQGVEGLFEVGGLQALTILHLKWIAESNSEIRKVILAGFAKIGDHRYIADPSFPMAWVLAAERFRDNERDARIKELRRYFLSDMERLGR